MDLEMREVARLLSELDDQSHGISIDADVDEAKENVFEGDNERALDLLFNARMRTITLLKEIELIARTIGGVIKSQDLRLLQLKEDYEERQQQN